MSKKVTLFNILGFIPFLIALSFYTGYVVSLYFGWFLEPLGFPKIPLISLVAMLSLLSIVTYKYDDNQPKTIMDLIGKMIAKIITLSFTLGMGYIYSLFL